MQNKSILLTGHSKGLGLATAGLLLAEGYNVYGLSRSITPELEELMKSIEAIYTH